MQHAWPKMLTKHTPRFYCSQINEQLELGLAFILLSLFFWLTCANYAITQYFSSGQVITRDWTTSKGEGKDLLHEHLQ